MNIKKNESGSITLEAALIVPMFMFFILFLVIIIQIAVAEIALNRAASQTTEYISTHVYPLKLVKNKINNKVSKNDNLVLASRLAGYAYKHFGGEGHAKELGAAAVERFVKQMFAETSGGMFDPEKVEVEIKELPVLLGGKEGEYLRIIVSYEMNIALPFMDTKTITLSQKAQERLWVGG